MSATITREPRIKIGVSLRRDQVEAIRLIAQQERHENVSQIVQRAVDREIERVDLARAEAESAELSLAS